VALSFASALHLLSTLQANQPIAIRGVDDGEFIARFFCEESGSGIHSCSTLVSLSDALSQAQVDWDPLQCKRQGILVVSIASGTPSLLHASRLSASAVGLSHSG
jgi:hypothetical protein